MKHKVNVNKKTKITAGIIVQIVSISCPSTRDRQVYLFKISDTAA